MIRQQGFASKALNYSGVGVHWNGNTLLIHQTVQKMLTELLLSLQVV
jgi:hypothetical protein